MNNKTALVLGATGQDGAHIAAHLLRRGCKVIGGFRRGSANKTWRLEHLGILKDVTLLNINIDEPFHLVEVFGQIRPDYIFHVAGESYVADSFSHPFTTFEANAVGTLNVLEAIRLTSSHARLFFASSSEVFGDAQGRLLDENSEFLPANPYAISKMTSQHLVRMYRQRFGIFGCTGILFNHEGPLRTRSFVTRKITYNLARILTQGGAPIELGAFDSERDWGSAEDYTEAMVKVLNLDAAEDFVFATGKLTSVREFLRLAAEYAGFKPVFSGQGVNELCVDAASGRELAKVSAHYFRPYDTTARAGSANRLKQRTDWRGSRSVERIVAEMMEADIERWKKGNINV